MHENDPAPEISETPAWNPLSAIPDEWRDLEVSGGRAAVLYRRWSGRERLAYEDAITERLLTTDERTGDDTVKLGSLRLFAATLTIKGSRGFPSPLASTDNPREFLTGTRDQVEADLLSITDSATLSEILRHAREVQPLPGQEPSSPADGDGSSDEDPSPASSTGPEPTSDDA